MVGWGHPVPQYRVSSPVSKAKCPSGFFSVDTLPSLPAKPSPVLEGLRVRAAASLAGWNCVLYQGSCGSLLQPGPRDPLPTIVPSHQRQISSHRDIRFKESGEKTHLTDVCGSHHTETSASRKVERKHISLMCVEVMTWRMRNSPSFSTFYVDQAMFQHFPQINTIPTAPPRGRFS